MPTMIENIIRPDLLDFTAYRSQTNREAIANIWLNANESPYPLELKLNVNVNRYPPRRPQSLLTTLANHYQVLPSNLLLSRGSDEAIDLLIRLCCRAGQDKVLICPPTFHMYEIYAKLQGAIIIPIPLIKDTVLREFRLPLSEILSQWQPDIKIIFVCSPNNPTGHITQMDDIAALCAATAGKALVVVDEAYAEFSKYPSAIAELSRFNNLVILRTLSKAFGLAGTRCGVTIAAEEVIDWLQKISAPYSLPTPSIMAIETAFNSENKLRIQNNISNTIQLRKKLEHGLSTSPLVHHLAKPC